MKQCYMKWQSVYNAGLTVYTERLSGGAIHLSGGAEYMRCYSKHLPDYNKNTPVYTILLSGAVNACQVTRYICLVAGQRCHLTGSI
jgi:hypothetical protein